MVLSPEVPIAADNSNEQWKHFVKQNRKQQSPVLRRLNDTQLITLGSLLHAGVESISQNFFLPDDAKEKGQEKMALESELHDQSSIDWDDDNDQVEAGPEDRAFISPLSSGDECDVNSRLSAENFENGNVCRPTEIWVLLVVKFTPIVGLNSEGFIQYKCAFSAYPKTGFD